MRGRMAGWRSSGHGSPGSRPTGAASRRSNSRWWRRCCCRMYFVTMEVSQAIETNKKVGRIASMVADLVTQQQTTTKAEVDAIMDDRPVAAAALQPLDSRRSSSPRSRSPTRRRRRSRCSGRASSVNGTTSAGAAKGTITTVPAALNTPRVVPRSRREHLDYKPVITWAAADKQPLGLAAAFDDISMNEDLLSEAAHEHAGDLLRLLNGKPAVLHSDDRGGSYIE